MSLFSFLDLQHSLEKNYITTVRLCLQMRYFITDLERACKSNENVCRRAVKQIILYRVLKALANKEKLDFNKELYLCHNE